MAMKGKEVAGKAPAKRKKESAGRSGGRKRRSSGVLQFFDVAADVRGEEEDESEEGEFDKDFLDEVNAELNDKNGLVKAYELPILPKEEELSGDELEKYLEERYKTGSHHVKYAGDEFGPAGERDSLMPSKNDPTIWRIKCMVGRERHIVFSLMHKHANLHSLGSKLKIVSAFALEHTKGFFYIEAERQSDVLEACKGLCNIYISRISPIPNNEVSRLISVQNTKLEVPKHMWARLKHGKYKGDLAQVVSVEEAQKRATVKLLPRIDVQALAKKLAGGGAVQEAKVPAPRIITSSDLEDIRRHIKSKRDRQTGEVFETVDGLTLKDGYLYKKVSVQSLKYLTELPSAEELEKFSPSNEDKSDDMEWLSQLYGEKQKKCLSKSSEKASKGESTSGTKKHSSKSMKATTKALEDTLEPKEGNGFQLHDLVFFGENDFGVIIGMEDDRFQILKDDPDGAKVVNVDLHEMKSGSLDKKFSTLGNDMIKLSLNDVVRVLEGPSEGKQGVIKHICQETVFIYDENQLENGGYFCANSQSCENISNCEDSRIENDGDTSGFPTSEDFAASPKSSKPPSNKRWENNTFNSNRSENKDCNFSIGQTLRIRVGPLKGHICRVVAIYRSDVTVRLDTQIKVITVKSEHLSVAGVKSIGNPEPNLMGSFDGFATGLSGATTNDGGWNSAALTGRRNPWPSFSSSDFLVDATAENPSSSNDPDKGEDKGDDPWGSKTTTKKVTDNWGEATGTGVGDTIESKAHQSDSWDRAADKGDSGDPASDQWGPAKHPTGEQVAWKDAGGGWDTGKLKIGNSADEKVSNWGEPSSNRNQPIDKGKGVVGDEASGWNQAKRLDEGQWGKGGGSDGSGTKGWGMGNECWDKPKVSDMDNEPSWNKGTGKSSEQSSWGKAVESSKATDVPSENAGGNDNQDGWKSKFGEGEMASNNNSWKNANSFNAGDSSGWKTKANDNGNSFETGGKQSSGWNDKGSSWNNSTGRNSSSLGGNQSSGWDGNWSNPKSNNQSSGWDGGAVANSFNASESSGWKTKADDKVNSSGQPSCWNDKGSSWNNSTGSKSSSLGGNQSSGWDGNWSNPKSNNQSSGWDGGPVANSFNSNESSGWKTKADDKVNSSGPGGNEISGWNGKGSNWNNSSGSKSSSLGGNQSSGGDGNWSNPKSNNQSSGWDGGPVANDKPKWSSDGGNGWNKKDNSNADQFGGWKAKARDSDGSKSNWSSLKDSGGTQSSSWSQKTATKEGADGIKDQEDGWNKGNASNAGWGSGQHVKGDAAGWGSGSSFGGDQSSGWGRRGNEGGSESQSDNWNKRAFGNKNDKPKWSSDGGNGWNKKDNSNADQVGGWKARARDSDGSKSNWSSLKDSGGTQSSSWSQKPATKEGADGIKDQEDGWNKGNASNAGWGSGQNVKGDAAGWGSGSSFGGDQSSGWGRRENEGGSESQSDNWNKRAFGHNNDNGDNNGGNWRVGGGSSGWNRGSSDNNGDDQVRSSYGDGNFGRGRSSFSDRGGFRGRGRRGGGRFGGQNGGRDYSEKTDDTGGGLGKGRWQESNDSCKGQWQQGSDNGTGSWGDEGSNSGQWQRGGNRGRGRFGGRGRGQDCSENNDSCEGQWQQGSSNSFGSWGDGDSGKGQWQRGGNRGGGRFGGRGRGQDSSENNDSCKGQWQQGSNNSTGSWGDGGSSRGQWQRGGNRGGGRFGGQNSGQDYSEKTDDTGDGGFGKGRWQENNDSFKGQWQQGSNNNVGSWGDGSSGKGQWQKDGNNNTGSGGQEGSSWGQQKQSSKNEGWGSGWNKGKDDSNESGSADHGSNWKQPQTSAASEWSGLKKGTDSAGDAGGGWNNGSNAGNNDSWSKPNPPNTAASSSGWNKTTDPKEESADAGQAKDPWEKAPSGSSLGKKGW